MKYFPTLSLGLFAGFLSFFATPAAADEAPKITIEQINDGTFSPRYIYGVHPLNDGESYSQLSADGRRITRSSFTQSGIPLSTSLRLPSVVTRVSALP